MWRFDPRMLQEEQEDKEKCMKKKTTDKKGRRKKVGKRERGGVFLGKVKVA